MTENKGKRIIIEKIARSKNGLQPVKEITSEFAVPFGRTLPLKYKVEGILQEEIELGFGVRILRDKKETEANPDIFMTTPVMKIDKDKFETFNSVYSFKFIESN